MAVWIIRGGFGAEAVDEFLETGTVGVGFWTGAEELNGLTMAGIRAIIERNYDGEGGSGVVTWATTQVWNFVENIKIGDTILMPERGGQRVHIGEVVGDCYLWAEVRYPQSRDVRWTGEMRANPLPRGRWMDQRTVIKVSD